MAKTETLHIRVNETVKKNAEKTLETLGISISEAINMFLCQVQLKGGLPFEVTLPPAPASLIVNSIEELRERVARSDEDYREGRVIDAWEAIDKLREEYGL